MLATSHQLTVDRNQTKIIAVRPTHGRAFVVFWSLLVVILFTAFSSVALAQVNHRAEIALDKIQAKQTAAIDSAYTQCMSLVESRETYRELFTNLGLLISDVSDIAARAMTTEDALLTRAIIDAQRNALVTEKLAVDLPPRNPELCRQAEARAK